MAGGDEKPYDSVELGDLGDETESSVESVDHSEQTSPNAEPLPSSLSQLGGKNWPILATCCLLVSVFAICCAVGVWIDLPWLGPIVGTFMVFGLLLSLAVHLYKPRCAPYPLAFEIFLFAIISGVALVSIQRIVDIYFWIYLQEAYKQYGSKPTKLFFLVGGLLITTLWYIIPQEILKFLLVFRVRNRQDFNNRYGCIILSVWASMGVGMVAQCVDVAFLYLAYERTFKLFGTWWAERLIGGMLINLLIGMWLGMGFSKRYFARQGKRAYTKGQVLLYPIGIRFTYHFFWQASFLVLSILKMTSIGVHAALIVMSGVVLIVVCTWTIFRIQKLLKNPSNYAPVADLG